MILYSTNIKKSFAIIAIGLMMVFASCKHEPDLANLPQISFEKDIQGILSANCTMSGCHNEGSENGSLVGYDNVMDVGDVRPGRADDSEIYELITEGDEDKRMPPPPKPALSDDNIKKIYLWIEEGAKNN